jgi:hypothetical protein
VSDRIEVAVVVEEDGTVPGGGCGYDEIDRRGTAMSASLRGPRLDDLREVRHLAVHGEVSETAQVGSERPIRPPFPCGVEELQPDRRTEHELVLQCQFSPSLEHVP